jgi:hypothetical protein
LSGNFLGWKWISWLISFQLIEILYIYLWLLDDLETLKILAYSFKSWVKEPDTLQEPYHFDILSLSWVFSSLCYWLNQEESDKPFSFYLPLWDPKRLERKYFFSL